MNITDALESCQSQHTRRSYERCLLVFGQWLKDRALNYDTVLKYRGKLVKDGHSPQSVNQHLAAIRFYARAMAESGQMPIEQANNITAVKSLKVKGRKLGNWLSIAEAEKLLNAPNTEEPVGLRDRAILALLIGAGLRRSTQPRSITSSSGTAGKSSAARLRLTICAGRSHGWLLKVTPRLSRFNSCSGTLAINDRALHQRPARLADFAV
jgi:hypothetical protein